MRHAAFVDWSQRHKPAVVLLGDSISDLWRDYPDLWSKIAEPYNCADFGIMSNITDEVVGQVRAGEVDAAKVVVLMIGTNDIGMLDRQPDDVANRIGQLVALIRSRPGHPRVLLLDILPRGQISNSPLRSAVSATNAKIAALADGRGVVRLDLGPRLLESDGSITTDTMPDYLHLSRKGYGIWADAMVPILREMLGQQPATRR